MNNRPFINNSRITLDMNVQPQAQPALEILCKLCHKVNQLDEKRALVALAAYMVVRAKYVPQYVLEIGKLSIESADQLSLAIQEFVTEKSAWKSCPRLRRRAARSALRSGTSAGW